MRDAGVVQEGEVLHLMAGLECHGGQGKQDEQDGETVHWCGSYFGHREYRASPKLHRDGPTRLRRPTPSP